MCYSTTMTLWVFLLVVSICSLASSSTSCEDGEYLPHESDCTKFYHCDHGSPVELTCGPGTAWSQDSLMCIYHHLVPSCEPSEPEPLCVEGDLRKSLDGDHNKYEECILCDKEPEWKTKRCAIGGYFDPSLNECLLSIQPNAKDKCIEGAYLQDPEDNTQVFRCQNNKIVQMYCFFGTYFNVETGKCTLLEQDIMTCPNLLPSTQCYNGVRFVYDDRFNTQYYECIDGVLVVQSCPAGEFLCPFFLECFTTVEPSISTKCRGGTNFLDHRDYRKYFLCEKDKIYHYNCPSGQYYDAMHMTCRSPEDEPIFWLLCNHGARFAHEDVTRYFECFNDILLQRKCRTGTKFDPITSTCEECDDVTCGQEVEVDPEYCPPCEPLVT